MRLFVRLGIWLGLALSCVALEIFEHDPDVNDIYLNWRTPEQALNPNNTANSNGLDLSGVGWGELGTTGERQASLVSETQVLMAFHFAWIGPIHFFSPTEQAVVTYYIGPGFERMPAEDGSLTDITLAPIFQDEALTVVGVDAAHGLAIYPIANVSPEPGQVIYPVGFGGNAGTNAVRVARESVDNVPLQPVLNTDVFGWLARGGRGEAFVVSGDSGSPTFIQQGGQTILAGMHIARGTSMATGELIPVSVDADLSLYAEFIAERATPLSSIEAWRLLHFGDRRAIGPGMDDADPDGDGMENLLEYAFGTDPNVSGASPVELALGPDDQPGVRFPFVPGHDDFSIGVEASGEVTNASWENLAEREDGAFVPAEGIMLIESPGTDAQGRRAIWLGEAVLSSALRRFFRVRAEP